MQAKLTKDKKKVLRAEDLAKKQREISISEFFAKNRHLLGFDNPRKALLTTIKEAVDNALDACEESKILPVIKIEIQQIKGTEDRFNIIVEDNGPGIVKKQIPKIFGKLLYGSKFHKLAQSRGQQGIGISASALYGQMTTGKGIKIISKTGKNQPAHYYEITLNTNTNNPEIVNEEEREWEVNNGTKLQLTLEGKYQKGRQSVDEYIGLTAIANPHATIFYKSPTEDWLEFSKATDLLPIEPKEIKPHPYGIELGTLIKMLKDTNAKTLQQFLTSEFSRVSSNVAKQICEKAGLYVRARPKRIARQEADNLYRSIQNTKIMSPPTNCLSPIGEDLILKGLKKEVDAEFYISTTRPPSVYRGNPFIVEAGIAYGGSLKGDELVKVIRLANRVPLQYKKGDCAVTKAVVNTAWRNYGLSQSRGALPQGAAIIMVHVASVWVPFTSESKEAVASYPEIIKELKLALQECGRKLGTHIKKKKRMAENVKKKSYIEKYLPHLTLGVKQILDLNEEKEKELAEHLKNILERSREI